MPTASRESSRSRRSRSNSKAKSPPPQKTPSQSQKKVNGVKNNSTPKSTKETSPKIPKDPKLYDLYADAACKLCDKKNFKLGTDALVKHYALEHFREKLEVDQKDFSCNVLNTNECVWRKTAAMILQESRHPSILGDCRANAVTGCNHPAQKTINHPLQKDWHRSAHFGFLKTLMRL